MPPTLTASLNPIDHPAFSPAFSAEPLPIRLDRHFGRASATAASTSTYSAPRIPYKFFASQQPSHVRTTRPTKKLKDIAQDYDRVLHPTAARHLHSAPKTPAPTSDLPEIPKWAMGMLVGGLTFLFVVAIVLFVAQFPPRFAWARCIKRWWKAGYAKLSQEDYELSEGSTGGRSSAVASTGRQQGRLKHRRPRLSIDTGVGVAYDGLGVVVPKDDEDDDWHTALQTRRSHDEEALSLQSKSSVPLNLESFTAPLPAIPTFTGGRRDVESSGDLDNDLEFSSRSAPATATPDFLDYISHLDRNYNVEYPGSALFKKVNAGIYHAADKLSRAFYDQVNQPEEGLLLPVREGDREKQLASGVVVD